MGYDTDVHIPGQIDFFLQSFNNKNVDGVNQSLKTIVDLVKDNNFKADIKGYESDYELQIKKIKEDDIKRIHNVKTIEEIVEILNENHIHCGEIYAEYWNIIKEYIIGYFKKIE